MTTVLLAEDDPDLCEVTTMLLASWGCEVTPVGSGGAAADLLEQEATYDVLVLDFDMPRLNGLDVAVRARELGHRGPIIVWTGWDAPVTPEAATRWGLLVMSKHDANELGSIVASLGAQDPSDLPHA
jgi:CheY-like chemotaxis protein